MSELRKKTSKPPAVAQPHPLPSQIQEEEEGLDGGGSSPSSISSTDTVVPHVNHLVQSPWREYFDEACFLVDDKNMFHTYLTAPKDIFKDPLFVCHHGAGSSALSFAVLASRIRERLPNAGVLAIDARNHGSLVVDAMTGDPSEDYSREALAADLLRVLHLTQAEKDWQVCPNLVLVGHSLGGAVVTEVAKSGALGNKLVGFAVIDVVEGSAMDALKSMQTYLSNRPSSFPSVEAAVEWHTRSRTIRNYESARISVPSLLRMSGPDEWTWITNLSATQPFWTDWFASMSKNFLAGRAAKLLLLAGTDRLDRELMIGQMQGKFQLQVFPEAGHFVQEDAPEKTADVLVEFYKRNDRSTLVLPPKVSDLLKQGKKV